MVDWDDFVTRRNVNFEEFKKEYEIISKQDLINCCLRFGINPPSELKLNSLFPDKIEHFDSVDNEENKVTIKKNKRSKNK